MGLIKKNILGIYITINPKQKVLEEIQKYLFPSPIAHERGERIQRQPLVVLTPNPEQIIEAQRNPSFAQILNRADIAIPDGIGVVWGLQMGAKKKGSDDRQMPIERISGVDLMQDIVQLAAKERVKIALIGGRSNLAMKSLECLQSTYVGLLGWSDEAPEMTIGPSQQLESQTPGSVDEYLEKLTRKIIETRTSVVFVGLGAPKQELFVALLKKRLMDRGADHHVVLMVVGGSFDMIAGMTPRAPAWIQRIGFEWLWRLIQEPWRWRRQLALFRFVRLVFRERFFHT